jgi:hypothetical protein
MRRIHDELLAALVRVGHFDGGELFVLDVPLDPLPREEQGSAKVLGLVPLRAVERASDDS